MEQVKSVTNQYEAYDTEESSEVCKFCKIKSIFALSSILKNMSHSDKCKDKNSDVEKS